MNSLLKVLAAIALIAVIVASASAVIHYSGINVQPIVITGDAKEGEESKVEPQTEPEPGSYRPDPRARPTLAGALDVVGNPIQPSYRPINQPAYLQMLRQEGKTYRSVVLGKLTGRASKSDWGLQGAAHFHYLYGLESSGKILSNDGVTIVEERTFKKVTEELLVSEYEVGIDLGKRLDGLLSLVQWAGAAAAGAGDVSGAGASIAGGAGTIRALDGKEIAIKKGWVNLARKAGVFDQFPQIDPEKFESELRMFTHGTNDRLLEGKTVRITFVDGQGITTIEPVGCMLSEKERDLIIRSNFALDHYIFPDRQVSPGEDWTVDGDTFSGFLDPRLSGKADGQVTISRTPDFIAADNEISKKLRLTNGEIVVREADSSQAVTGQLTGMKGILTIPEASQIITSAELSGSAVYQSVSTDHLLFEAKHSMIPEFEIKYRCSVE